MGPAKCMRWGRLQSTRQKRAGRSPLELHRSLLSVCLYRPVDDSHPVAAVPGRSGGLSERAGGAVVVAHDDLVLLLLLHFLLYLVPAKSAAERPEDRGYVLAAAAADLVAQDAADDRAADRPDARGLSGLLDRAYFFDHTALAADRCDGRGRRRRG